MAHCKNVLEVMELFPDCDAVITPNNENWNPGWNQDYLGHYFPAWKHDGEYYDHRDMGKGTPFGCEFNMNCWVVSKDNAQIDANYYQDQAYRFAVYPGREYPFIALSEETGEVSGKLAKYVRKNQCTLTEALEVAKDTTSQLHQDLKGELGGVLWNLAACCTDINLSLGDLMEDNLQTLQGRKERGTIVGSGDSR